MKKTLVYGTATAVVVAALGSPFALARCRSESVESLYGPPSMYSQDDDDDPIEDVYGPPVIEDPEPEDPVEDVYGPPVFEDPEVEEPVEDFYGPPVTD